MQHIMKPMNVHYLKHTEGKWHVTLCDYSDISDLSEPDAPCQTITKIPKDVTCKLCRRIMLTKGIISVSEL